MRKMKTSILIPNNDRARLIVSICLSFCLPYLWYGTLERSENALNEQGEVKDTPLILNSKPMNKIGHSINRHLVNSI
jgi:hypothetical protein